MTILPTATTTNRTKLIITLGDITRQDTDAIVNAANTGLMGGGGVDGAIHRAGGSTILRECQQIISQRGYLRTGQAVVTSGGNLKARHVIHTVGPIWQGGNKEEASLLASAYHESLKLATTMNLHSISFPSISTGAYGYPVDKAAEVALKTAVSFLNEAPTTLNEIVFVLFDTKTYNTYSTVLKDIQANFPEEDYDETDC